MTKKSVEVVGGNVLEDFLKKAKEMATVRGYEVGFYSSSRYPDGTSVAYVAGIHEFGIGVPRRPFFSVANENFEPVLLKRIKANLKNERAINRGFVSRLAVAHAGAIQNSITDMKEPWNAESTILAKNSSNPLIDTGFMRQSVTWKVL